MERSSELHTTPQSQFLSSHFFLSSISRAPVHSRAWLLCTHAHVQPTSDWINKQTQAQLRERDEAVGADESTTVQALEHARSLCSSEAWTTSPKRYAFFFFFVCVCVCVDGCARACVCLDYLDDDVCARVRP